MKIITYKSENAPASIRWCAKWLSGKNLLPIAFTAPTEQEAIGKAERWWAEGEEKRAKAAQKRKERAEARAKREAKKKEQQS